RRAGARIAAAGLADAPLIGGDEYAGDGRGEVRVVGLHPPLLDLAGVGWNREHPLGRLVHQRGRAAGVGHHDWVGDRIDDEVQPVALRARLHVGDAHLAIVLLDLFAGAPQVGDVSENRYDAAALPRILGHRAEEL